MVPAMRTEAVRFQQAELAHRVERVRRRREAREQRSTQATRTYPDVMRFVDEAHLAARSGLIPEAQRLIELAYGSWARPRHPV